MTTIDEIEELRAELRHCHLTATERRGAEARLAVLLRARNLVPCDRENYGYVGASRLAIRNDPEGAAQRIDAHAKLVQYATAHRGEHIMDDTTRAAFERLLDLAKSDTGQARRAANFILAWWNADSLGGFDIAELFGQDTAIAADMAIVFGWIARRSNAVYPEEYRAEIEGLIEAWRPQVWARSKGSASADSPVSS